MKIPKVTVFGVAYNAEKYITETIESILAQTEQNWEFVLCNNGSTDKTGKICDYYAKKDPRIRVFHNKVNCLADSGIPYPERKFWPDFYGEYVTMIDSDDLFHPQFIEKTYLKAKQSNADIVAVSSLFFQDGSNPYNSNCGRYIPECLVTTDNELDPLFSVLYPCFRPVWGKLFRKDFFEQYYDYAWLKPSWLTNGMDTFCSLGYLQYAKIVAGISTPLHYYRLRKASAFYTLDTTHLGRIRTGQALFDRGMECLKAHHIDSPQNISYLFLVLIGHMCDLLNLMPQCTAPAADKLYYLHHMLNAEIHLDKRIFHIGWEQLRQPILDALAGCCGQPTTSGLEWNHYLIRLYAACKELTKGTYLQFIAIYSAISCAENSNYIGIEEIKSRTPYNERERIFQELSVEKQMDWLSSTEKIVRWYNDSSRISQFEELSQQLEYYLQSQQLVKIIETLSDMEIISPLDELVLYFKGLISWQIGEQDVGLKILQCAKAFYPDNSDIVALHKDMCDILTS